MLYGSWYRPGILAECENCVDDRRIHRIIWKWLRAELTIEDWRDEIDRLDEQLVKLLNARSQCAIELGRIKRELGLAIYSPDREREVIAHVTGINPGPLDKTAIRRLFERIIDESRRIERVTVEKETKDGTSVKRKRRPKE